MKWKAAVLAVVFMSVAVRANALTMQAGDSRPVVSTPVALATGDLNHDGSPDVVVFTDDANNRASAFLADGSGGYVLASTPSVVIDAVAGAIADVNGDGKPDIVSVGSSNGNINFRFGDGNGSFPTSSKFQTSSTSMTALAVGDLNADGKTDVVTDAPKGGVRVVLGDGSGGFSAASGGPFAVKQAPSALAVADMNGDRWPDVVAASSSGGTVSVLRGSSTGALTLVAERNLGSRPSSIVVADFDGDGATDVAAAEPDAGVIAVLRGDGAGNLGDGAHLSVPAGTRALATGDMNDDGAIDLVAASDTADTLAVVLGDGSGGFVAAAGSPFAVPGAPESIAVVGRDVVIARAASNDLLVERNTSTRGLTVSPSSVDFGPQGAGTTSDARYVTASSDGLVSTITAVTADGDFVIADDGCTGRRAGDGYPSCDVEIAFAPSDVGPRSGDLTFAYDDGDSVDVPLSGSGIDITPPETRITGGPSGLTNDPAPVFTFDSDDPTAHFECSVDGADYSACSSPDTLSLADGDHTFAVRAVDPAGNVDATPASASFTIDTQAPDVSLTGGPSDRTRDDAPSFTFASSDETASFECRMDDAPFAACASPVDSAQLADGTHTFAVRATDAAGNTSDALADTFTVDTTAPDTAITGHPDAQTSDDRPVFSFAATESDAAFECAIDAAAFASCVSPFQSTQLEPGAHTFAVRATDAAGNVDPTPATYTFTVVAPDTQGPETTITEHPDALSNDTTPTFRFISDESGSTFTCAVDDGDFRSCGSPFTTDVLTEGHHLFRVAAVDASGNVDPTPDSFAVTIDVTQPQTTIVGRQRMKRNQARFIFQFSENVQSVWCSVDGSGYSECRTPYSGRALRPGKHTLEVRAVDPAGNTEGTPAIKRFTIVRNR